MLTPYLEAPERLDAYSQQMAERIFALHPEWRELAQVSRANTLLVTIPWVQNPHGDIVLATFNHELTIFVGSWHAHFNELPDFETTDEGFELLEHIFENEFGFLVKFYDGHAGSGVPTERSVEEEINIIKKYYRSADSKKQRANIEVVKYYWSKAPEKAEFHK